MVSPLPAHIEYLRQKLDEHPTGLPMDESEFQRMCLEALYWIAREVNLASENVRGCGARLERIEAELRDAGGG